jgi:hypothetical protein
MERMEAGALDARHTLNAPMVLREICQTSQRDVPMTTEEIIARALCRADGWDPDGFNQNAPNRKQWELWVKRQAIFLAALSSAGYEIVPRVETEEMRKAGGEIVPEYEGSAESISAQVYRAMIQAATAPQKPNS